MTTRERLIEDAENMEEIMSRLELTKDDIWQNRFIYWIAKAVYDVLREVMKRG